ncbi:MAG: hypothetical protein HN916_08595 [Anaerolineae bacterium]|nr:hypothetical protein [Anaerolineae bacterium]MBT7988898.1 hypothetical protein [Anaerolineae bacterium]
MEEDNKKHIDSWKLFERVGVIIALVASLATVVGLLLQVRSEKRMIEMQIVSADQLTRLPSVNGLDGEFTYNGIPVTDLWRLKIQFVNSGDETLIGEGASSSLITDVIPVIFPPTVNILNASSEADSFYSLTQSDKNIIEISFSQWRPTESFETIVYISSNEVLDSFPVPTVKKRPIINGNIKIIDFTIQNETQPQPAINHIPPPFAFIGKVLGGLLASLIGAGSLGFLIIAAPISYARAKLWKYKYMDDFKEYLKNIELSDEEKEKLLKYPWASQIYYSNILLEVLYRTNRIKNQSKGYT